ncbi:MAG: AsmA family protein [Paracoccaceae bacterium]
MKWILRIVGALLLLIVVAVGALFFLPADRIAKVATDQMRNVTGRDVSISGDVSMTLWPVLGVSAGELEVGNAEWSAQGPMLTAEKAAIGINAAALLRGEIQITHIEAVAPTIRLEQKADGRASWQFSDATGEATIETETSPSKEAQAFSLNKLTVTDATFVYDAEGSDLVSYSGVDFTLDWPERLGAADIRAKLSPTGEDVVLEASIEQFAGFITGQVQPIDVTLSAGGGRATLNGRASTAGDVAGRLTLNLPSTDAFFRALDLPAPGLPKGLGAAVEAETNLTLTTDRKLALRDLSANLGGNVLNGAADISLNGIPQINVQLDGGDLDLSVLSASSDTSGDSSGQAAPAGSGWPKDRIDASGLAAFNGDIAFTAKAIDLGTLKLGATRALLRNDRSRMVFELREVNAYDGVVTGEFVLNNRSGLSVGGKLKGAGISVQGLLNDAAGLNRLTGSANLDLSFLGVGENVDTIMRSLSGQGAFRLGEGTIEGLDLNRLMSKGDGSGGTTIFDSLTASYTMQNGDMLNEDLLLALRSFEARGAGRIGIGAQDIDYLFTPIALKLNEGKGLAIPIRIRGPWSDPSILPDLGAAIDLNLEAEKDRIREEAKDKVKAKVAEKLGVQDGAVGNLEDAAKDKVKDELKKGLGSLFD